MVLPKHAVVRVSCVFTLDREFAEALACQWEGRTDKPVTVGGPAFGIPAGDSVPGLHTIILPPVYFPM